MNRHPDKHAQQTKPPSNNKVDAVTSPTVTKTGKRQNQGDSVGEGNRDAARRYDRGVAESEARGDSDSLAREAKDALDGPEGEELRESEETAKRGEPNVAEGRNN